MWEYMNTQYEERLMEGMQVNASNHLEIGQIDATELVKKYGSPLYVYDIAVIKNKIKAFKQAFRAYEKKTQVAYASKAFSSLALYEILANEDVSLDVVSGGELHLALKAGFPAERIHFHGNNKSYQELKEALNHGIGCIVIDNFHEIDLLQDLTEELEKTVDVLVRVTPGIEAHTHEYITTGQEDSKFGFDLTSNQVEKALKAVEDAAYLNGIGLHAHIGSQIFEVEGYEAVIEKLLACSKKWSELFGFELKVLNVGGGFGIRYTEEDDPRPLEEYAISIMDAVRKEAAANDLPLPEIWIEPGRSIVGEAGTSLYTIGSEKILPNIRKYIAIDGGMSDNIRPALYQASYTGVVANRVSSEKSEVVSVAGKACESGDMLIWDIVLPEPKNDDILAVFSTGAYGYSMASNYNRLPRPAVVFVENGKYFLAIQRETYTDFMHLENSIRM